MATKLKPASNPIGSLVRQAETDYTSGNTTISKYVSFNLYETINRIDAYLNSKHVSGDSDALGREKPFFNIVTAAANIWHRATDIDRKDIIIKPVRSRDITSSFLATIHLQNWMRKDNFGEFLNEWGRTLARYGSAVVKFVETGDQLHSMVIPWNRLIVDSIDFESNPRIEILELTPAQLMRHPGYDKAKCKKLLDALSTRKMIDGQQKDNKTGYIKLYEVHGEMPLSYLTGDEDDATEFVQQMHVISYIDTGKENSYEDFTLASGKEDIDPYLLTHLIKEDGRVIGIGAVEHLFESQWMVNHTAKAIKDQLDLASKLIFQTSDGRFVNQNALSAIETGDILIHSINQPLTQVGNNSHDIGSLQSYGNQWRVLAQEITGTPDVLMGNNMPSGTAFRQASIIQQEAHSNFELMTENKGLALEEMARRFILPFIKKKMDTVEEISATLDTYGIKEIDELYIRNEAVRKTNEWIVNEVINNRLPTSQDQALMMADESAKLKEALQRMGNHRFYKPSEIDGLAWKEILKDFEWDVEVQITGESSNKEVVMSTLNTVLQTVAANPNVLQDQNMKMIFNRILSETGIISPVEIAPMAANPAVVAPQPVKVQ